jgi:hypothetical protein
VPVGLLNVELDEGAGQLFLLPRRARLTGTQADDHVLPADRLTRMQSDVLHDPVALVEDPENRNALRHGSHPGLAVRGGSDLSPLREIPVLLLRALAAGCERERGEQGCS